MLVLEQSLRQIESAAHASLRKTFECVDVGPFCAYFDPLIDLIWLNYAAPVRSIDDTRVVRKAIRDLRAGFALRKRRLRFEFMQPLWPGLRQILLDEGLVEQAQPPLMVCTPQTFRPRASGELRIQELTASDDALLGAFVRTAAEGFADLPDTFTPEQHQQRLRSELQSNMRYAVIGWMGDAAAGVASLSPMGNVAELAGVTTLRQFRRRGIAAALSSHLIAGHFRRAGTVAWLSAGDSVAQSAYHTIGFADAGSYANYFDPEPGKSE